MSEIPYIFGLTVKPYSVDRLGFVLFTDGTYNDINPNQKQCLAYGYKYDSKTQSCRAYIVNNNLTQLTDNENNKVIGVRNYAGTGTIQTNILGTNNYISGMSRNLTVGGENNTTETFVQNAFVYGVRTEVTTSNSISLGGNQVTDKSGKRQVTKFILGGTSVDATPIDLNLNNTPNEFYTPLLNCVSMFDIDVLGVRTGGTGTVGDYKSFKIKGVFRSRTGGEISPDENNTITILQSEGSVTGWGVDTVISESTEISEPTFQFNVRVTGDRGTTVEWVAKVEITQLKI